MLIKVREAHPVVLNYMMAKIKGCIWRKLDDCWMVPREGTVGYKKLMGLSYTAENTPESNQLRYAMFQHNISIDIVWHGETCVVHGRATVEGRTVAGIGDNLGTCIARLFILLYTYYQEFEMEVPDAWLRLHYPTIFEK